MKKAVRTKAALLSLAVAASLLVPSLGPASAAEQVVFSDTATIQGMNPAIFFLGTSATDFAFFTACPDSPLQDVDGHAFTLPQAAPSSGWTATAEGSGSPIGHDLDLVFYDSACGWISTESTEEVDESAPVPADTRYVLVAAFHGIDTDVELTVTETVPDPDPTPTPTPTPSPSPTEYLRGDYSAAPSDTFFADQWNLERIQAHEAWNVGNSTGYGITIAVVDGGIDVTHPDFDCLEKVTLLPGAETGTGGDNVQDDFGHGTHVSGIAAACTNNGEGVAGVAPDAHLLPVKYDLYDSFDGTGLLPSDLDQGMADGIRFATANGAHVINLSIGHIPPFSHLGKDGFPETEAAMEEAREAGVVIAAAAGNFNQPTCEYPSFSRNVICVVATTVDDELASYSDFAVNLDRDAEDPTEVQPVVAAPGGDGDCADQVISTWWRGGDHGCPAYGNGYDAISGTSMASPHVAGLAALLYDRLGGVRSKANADLIVQTILDTADDLGGAGWDPFFGYGRINALRAVQAITPPAP